MEPLPLPPDYWHGQTVAILAGGPSLTQAQVDEVRRRGWVAVAINTSFVKAPWADMLYAADGDWWHHYWPETEGFAGVRVVGQAYRRFTGVRHIPPRAPVTGGGNSAVHATLIARHCSASRIVLLGVDLDPAHLTHHHGLHPGTLRNPKPSDFALAQKAWRRLAPALSGIEVINCNPQSALTLFPRVPLESVAP